MIEEKETKAEEPKDTTDDNAKGDKPESSTLIEQANAAAQRLEEANKRQEELLNRQEELQAKRILGGRTEGSRESVVEKETDQEYSAKLMRGEVNPLGV